MAITNTAPSWTIVSELQSLLVTEPIDEVFISVAFDRNGPLIESLLKVCQEQGVVVRLQPDLSVQSHAKPYVGELDGVPLVTLRSVPRDGWAVLIKRLLDVFASAALLLALAPLLLLTAVLIRIDSPGPILFSQERVGLNKRRFRLLKFRTMIAGADQQQQALEHLNEANGPVFKIKHDPRTTRVGTFLRRYSIDELPQLINVGRGDMSLVGPRPLPLRDVERINVQWHKRRFSVKPGITCLWQVNGRSDISFERWVQMDLEYIDSWCLGLDMKILFKTIPTVLAGYGAY